MPCTPRRVVSIVIRTQYLLITACASWVSGGTDEHDDHSYIVTLVEDLTAVTMNGTWFRYVTPCSLAKMHCNSDDCLLYQQYDSWEAVKLQLSFR